VQGSEAGLRGGDVIERADEQIVQNRIRVLRLDGGFQKLAKVGRQQRGGVVFSQSLAPIADGNLAQNVQFAASGGLECDFAAEEQIEAAGKRTLRPPRSLGHGFHQPVVLGEPVRDQAGIREPREADDDGPGGLHGADSGENAAGLAMENPGGKFREESVGESRILPITSPHMLTRPFIAIFLAATTCLGMAEEAPWVPLFNGKDLSGWTPKIRGCKPGENFQNTFRVENGVIKADYSDYKEWDSRFGHLFHEKKFSNYRLRLEYRFTGEQIKGGPGWAFRNSGVMIHSESPEQMELEQPFPTSLEVQLLGGTGNGERTTGNLCTPGTHVEIDGKLETNHCISSKSKTFHGDQWVKLEIEVRGNGTIRHLINGEEVMTYSKPHLGGDAHSEALAAAVGDKMLSEGYICLQSESSPVEFRNIEVQELKPE
jgi:hypothetical protein